MEDTDDPFDLNRFVWAQQAIYDCVLTELKQGRKRSHWMWFVFPQLAGLGHSITAKHYAINSADEALAYWRHPLLGARLVECTTILLRQENRDATAIFGFPDCLKLHSSMTLFAALVDKPSIFKQVLTDFFAGQPDVRTVQLLAATKT